MIGVEAGGEGIRSGKHAARFQGGRLGVLQGTKTFLLANEEGQIELTHSVSAGLDYAAVGPEHSYLRDLGRVEITCHVFARVVGELSGMLHIEAELQLAPEQVRAQIRRDPGWYQLVALSLELAPNDSCAQRLLHVERQQRQQ